MTTRRSIVLASAASMAAAQWPLRTVAQGATQAPPYPTRPIRFVMPYAPGGSSEILARPIAVELSKSLGQQVIVDFKPGGGTTIGADFVAKSPPDGYNIVMMLSAHAINATLMPRLPYDPVKDFAVVTMAATLPLVVVVPASSPIRTFQELLAAARARPGKLTFASAGPGNTSHLSVEYLKSLLKIDMIHVPYKGSGPAIVGLLGNEVDFMFDSLSSSLPQIRAGKLRAIAMASKERSRVMPEVATVAEQGVPGFDVSVWYAVLAPAATPPAVVRLLNAEIIRAMRTPEAREKIEGYGYDLWGSSPAEGDAFVRSEIVRWGKVVRESGATVN